MTELIDVYDENGVLTGAVKEREHAFFHEGEYALYVLAIVRNPEGRFLITQRSQEKHWAAGWWEVPGGGVSSGETAEQAVVRELREEVGLQAPDSIPAPIHCYRNVDSEHGDNYIVNIFLFDLDVDLEKVVLQREETVDCRLATADEIAELAEQGVFLHYRRLCDALACIQSR